MRNNTGGRFAATPAGVGLQGNFAGSESTLSVGTDVRPLEGAPFSIATVLYSTGAGAWNASGFRYGFTSVGSSSTQQAQTQHLQNSPFQAISAGTAANYLSNSARYVLVAVYEIGQVPRLYVNGALVVSATITYNGSQFIGTDPTGIFATRESPHALIGAAWDRVLSELEIAALSENPWQLFRAPRPIIYSLPASGTPTLSAATVIDIGTTSARPRVTITI